ncbi:hypothetical protein [Kribbella caucasensis]|nr:hypothetical protein [Kribbella sp. VKM Ac-2527]
MRSLMSLAEADEASEPAGELAEILDAGWYTADCGALLLVGVGGHAATWPCDPASVGEREYEINDVRVPDGDLDEDRDHFLPAVAARADGFARAALRRATGMPGSDRVAAVISVGVDDDYLSHGTTVKFFTSRGSYPDWFGDLERFRSEAMRVLEIADVNPAEPLT